MSAPERAYSAGAGTVARARAEPEATAIRSEQAYVDWAYERLDTMLRETLDRENVGIHRAASHALWRMKQERADRIRSALADGKGLVIGRLDMTDDETWYVGRHPVDGEAGNPAVIEWQADLARLFYQATRTFPAGVGRRRTIRMSYRTVTGTSDETLVAGFVPPRAVPAVQPAPVPVRRRTPQGPQSRVSPAPPPSPPGIIALPDPVPAAVVEEAPEYPKPAADEVRAADLLLDELARQRTGLLEEVVATIQADQDRLIRAPMDVPIVVQGGPGTGKTIVGLHRAAWVLYQQRQRLIHRSVLVVGPNRRFLSYIASVLPSLGETDARQVTVDELAVDGLPAGDRDRVRVESRDGRGVSRIKGDARMAKVIHAAVWSRARPKAVVLPHGRFTLRLSTDQVDAVIGSVWRRGVPYKDARRQVADELAQALADEYVRRASPTHVQPSELRELAKSARSHLTKGGALTKMLPAVEARELVQRLFADRALLALVGGTLTDRERALLHRNAPPRRGMSPWTSADLPLLDEATARISDTTAVSGHVVVDEAQDLTPMQWRVVARRVSRGSMTILGDLGQATSSWSPRSWEEVAERANVADRAQVAELKLGYRVPRQVMEFASPLLDVAAPGVQAPRSFRSTMQPLVRRTAPPDLSRAAVELARDRLDRGAVAIIASRRLHNELADALGSSHSGITLLGPEDAKGLEFDVVVVVEPAAIGGRSQAGLRLLYVVLTRATKELIVVHSKPLPGGIGASHRPAVPSAYPNPRDDDPWDNDVVHWLLDQPRGDAWTRGVLMECLRRQAGWIARNPTRVEEAARLARSQGVAQDEVARGKRTITRLYRTDRGAPEYPVSEAARQATLKAVRK